MAAQTVWDQGDHTTVYADWIPIESTVTLDKDGGSGTDHTIMAAYGKQLSNVDLTVPKKDGFVFDGYYAGRNGQGTQYSDRYFYRKEVWDQTGAEVTIYAKWISY